MVNLSMSRLTDLFTYLVVNGISIFIIWKNELFALQHQKVRAKFQSCRLRTTFAITDSHQTVMIARLQNNLVWKGFDADFIIYLFEFIVGSHFAARFAHELDFSFLMKFVWKGRDKLLSLGFTWGLLHLGVESALSVESSSQNLVSLLALDLPLLRFRVSARTEATRRGSEPSKPSRLTTHSCSSSFKQ